jgi:hypothetical protein
MEHIESPCISVCKVDPANRLCAGCWRTIEEIRDWTIFDRDQRLEVLEQLHARRIAAGGRDRRSTSRRRNREQVTT